MITVFWICIFLVFYTFLGYPILLFILVKFRRIVKGNTIIANVDVSDYPSCTLIIAAYNEESFIEDKIANTLGLNYPEGKLELLFITDGSTDRTAEIINLYPQIRLMHQAEREGKIAAIHRAVENVSSEIIVFTDANTFLNEDALLKICRHYQDKNIGAVAGEKRVHFDEEADASTTGEGFYWKYESTLKKWDSELYSVVGAAGELFSVRKELYTHVDKNTILDDFMISMLITQKGFQIKYEPEAYAIETSSENVAEELKRKIRIAAGGMQSIIALNPLLNVFKYGILSFQYISHRVLRWTITPFLLILTFILNITIVYHTSNWIYSFLLLSQGLFYLLALSGYFLEKKQLRIKILFVPFYFCVMNYAVIAGISRYLRNKQTAVWEKSKRK